MNHESTDTNQLGNYVRATREAAGWSLRRLAAATGVNPTWLMRLERGQYHSPDPRLLARLAQALGIDTADLFLAADYRGSDGLPGFAPYLRAKYELPPEAVDQLAAHFDLINERYRRSEGGRRG
jgi:transcriptional regulator with XRE-family HTH domain